MKMEQNAISRDWATVREGRRFMVNFTESDGQILALCNRDNWEVLPVIHGDQKTVAVALNANGN